MERIVEGSESPTPLRPKVRVTQPIASQLRPKVRVTEPIASSTRLDFGFVPMMSSTFLDRTSRDLGLFDPCTTQDETDVFLDESFGFTREVLPKSPEYPIQSTRLPRSSTRASLCGLDRHVTKVESRRRSLPSSDRPMVLGVESPVSHHSVKRNRKKSSDRPEPIGMESPGDYSNIPADCNSSERPEIPGEENSCDCPMYPNTRLLKPFITTMQGNPSSDIDSRTRRAIPGKENQRDSNSTKRDHSNTRLQRYVASSKLGTFNDKEARVARKRANRLNKYFISSERRISYETVV